jgi:hypothetical protein
VIFNLERSWRVRVAGGWQRRNSARWHLKWAAKHISGVRLDGLFIPFDQLMYVDGRRAVVESWIPDHRDGMPMLVDRDNGGRVATCRRRGRRLSWVRA